MSTAKSQLFSKRKLFGKVYGLFLMMTIIIGIILGDFALIIPLINGNMEKIPVTFFILIAALLVGILALLIFQANKKRI